jgi:ABC-type dipeptide transport system, periplasmic component
MAQRPRLHRRGCGLELQAYPRRIRRLLRHRADDRLFAQQRAEDGKTFTEIWDANAIEKVDDYTVRLNCKEPQLAVPEHLFHYPFAILDPEEGGKFGVGSNGTGAFDLVEHEVGKKSVLKARSDYWGTGPFLDSLVFVDLGDTPSLPVAALAAHQVEGMLAATPDMLPALQKLDFCTMYKVDTSETDLVRVKVSEKPFDDPRVRKAMRLAVDAQKVQLVSLGTLGTVAEHHHVSPIHPEYAKLPPMQRDVAAAKKLLADAAIPTASRAPSPSRRRTTPSRRPWRPWCSNGRRPASG